MTEHRLCVIKPHGSHHRGLKPRKPPPLKSLNLANKEKHPKPQALSCNLGVQVRPSRSSNPVPVIWARRPWIGFSVVWQRPERGI